MLKLKKIRIAVEDLYDKMWVDRITKSNLKEYSVKGHDVNIKKCLTSEEKNQIDRYFQKYYGKKIPYDFHNAYKSYSGKFDVRYFPEHLYESRLLRFGNPQSFMDVFEDKNFLPIFAERVGVKIPRTLVYKIKNMYFDGNHNVISRNKAKKILEHQREFIIKPSEGTCGGNGIKIFDKTNFCDVEKIFLEYQGNFMIQELVESHSTLKELHPQSLNTIRIVTYILGGEIYHITPIIRMGVSNSKVDNACAGGILAGVDDCGYMTKKAMNRYCTSEKMTHHPTTHIKFENYKIEGIENVIKEAKKLHSFIPQVTFVDWDFTVDKNGDPILIEANVDKGGGLRMSQWTHGKAAFGNNTEKILRWISNAEKMTKSERHKKNIFL